MEPAEARLEAAKLSADWCKWMVLQTGICAGLWTLLKNSPKSALLWAWVAFALSVLATSWLLGRLPGLVALLAETGAEPQRSCPHQGVETNRASRARAVHCGHRRRVVLRTRASGGDMTRLHRLAGWRE